ncbi:MAG: Crp/Fnr family transcriptional regulator [Marinilabiliales bacterium]|nr:MAG: Crp/Fnr family transcriptional regulator [Marinilabiliales bacterium]
MFEQFIQLLNQYAALSKKEVNYIRELKSGIRFETLKKNEIVVKEGEIFNSMYFVLNGCIRLYYNMDGYEKTAFFYTKGDFIRSVESYRHEVPIIENYQAIEDTVVVHFSKALLLDLVNRFSSLERIAHIAIEQELISAQNIIYSFIAQSPEERYSDLISSNKELFLNVNQYYIASFLGITPESLSRIRKRTILKDKKTNS